MAFPIIIVLKLNKHDICTLIFAQIINLMSSNEFFSLIALERDDQKILSVHMSTPISHGEITGKMVKIIFSSEHNIQTALKKVFAEKPQSASASKVLAYSNV